MIQAFINLNIKKGKNNKIENCSIPDSLINHIYNLNLNKIIKSSQPKNDIINKIIEIIALTWLSQRERKITIRKFIPKFKINNKHNLVIPWWKKKRINKDSLDNLDGDKSIDNSELDVDTFYIPNNRIRQIKKLMFFIHEKRKRKNEEIRARNMFIHKKIKEKYEMEKQEKLRVEKDLKNKLDND